MTYRMISLRFVLSTALAVVLAVAGMYYVEHYFGPVDRVEADQSVSGSRGVAELPNSDGRFSRVHLLLSNMK